MSSLARAIATRCCFIYRDPKEVENQFSTWRALSPLNASERNIAFNESWLALARCSFCAAYLNDFWRRDFSRALFPAHHSAVIAVLPVYRDRRDGRVACAGWAPAPAPLGEWRRIYFRKRRVSRETSSAVSLSRRPDTTLTRGSSHV